MAQQGSRKINWFAIWVSVAVVVALVLVSILVVTLNNRSEEPDPVNTPAAANIDTETGAIIVGTGENRLDTYIDFMCPICNQFEQVYGAEIESLVEDGSITLGVHPISILDRESEGTEFSTRAANAAYCVASVDGEATLPFLQAMFANQPQERTPGLTDEQILEVAASVGVTGIESCQSEGTYRGFVAAMTERTPSQPGSQGIGTPTVAVNGEVIANSQLPEPGQLMSLFE
jgi:protein-disulfide isomerase